MKIEEKRKNDASGISLITLVITIVVLIILAGIGMNAGRQQIDKAQVAKIAADLEQYQEELRAFKMI